VQTEEIFDRKILEENKICKRMDKIEFIRLPFYTPTNIYQHSIITINGNKRYFMKKLKDKNNTPYFNQELTTALYFSKLKMTPTVVYHDWDQNIIITKYINRKKICLNWLIPKLAKKIRAFHNSGFIYEKQSYLSIKDIWLDKFQKLPLKIQEDFRPLFNIVSRMYGCYDLEDEVTSHNDLHMGNILIGNNLYIIDFDHLSKNTKYFDFATLAIYLRLNEKQEHFLLKKYDSKYCYKKYSTQKIICIARYGMSDLSHIENILNIKQISTVLREPFSFQCKNYSDIDLARLESAYNWLNYLKYFDKYHDMKNNKI